MSEETVEDWRELEEIAGGRLQLEVTDDKGRRVAKTVYTRVKGDGAVQLKQKGNAPDIAQNEWAKERRDKAQGNN